MSYPHPFQQSSLGRTRKQIFTEDSYHSSYHKNLDGYSSCSSSPPRSSSPPKTPYSSRTYAHIHSSPEITAEPTFRGFGERMDDAWSHLNSSWKSSPFPMSFYARPPSSVSTAPTSDFDPFESSHDAESEMSSLHAAEAAHDDEVDDLEDLFGLTSRSTFFRTSAERGLWKSDPIPFKKAAPIRLQTRKSAPSLSRIPTPTLLATRPISEPATSTLAQPASFLEGSENAALTGAVSLDASQTITIPIEPVQENDVTSPLTLPSLTSDRGSSEDIDVELETEDPGILSSPLPPSSPPLSPLSRSMSVLSRCSSPLSVLPDERSSSPLSDLPDDYDDEFEFRDMQEDQPLEPMTVVETEHLQSALSESPDATSDEVSDAVTSHDTSNSTLPQVPFKSQSPTRFEPSTLPATPCFSESNGPTLDLSISSNTQFTSGSSSKKLFHLNDVDVDVTAGLIVKPSTSTTSDSGPSNNTLSISLAVTSHTPASVSGAPVTESPVHVNRRETNEDKVEKTASAKKGVDDVPDDVIKPEPETTRLSLPVVGEEEERMDVDEGQDVMVEDEIVKIELLSASKKQLNTLKDKNGVSNRASSSTEPSARSTPHIEPVLKDKRKTQASGGPAKKRRRLESEPHGSGSREGTADSRVHEEGREEDENDRHSAAPAPKQKRRRRAEGDANSVSTKRTSRKRPRGSTPDDDEDQDQYDEPLDDEAKSLHTTVCGLVIETMATTRASTLPVSSIYKLVMRSQPSLKSQRTEPEWLRVFERVLRDGEMSRGCGVFGKVDSSGKDNSDRPLEAQWFYVPERDEDQERAALIRSMMPRPGKRTETMKYKQYYWRPVGKISKWDPEEEL